MKLNSKFCLLTVRIYRVCIVFEFYWIVFFRFTRNTKLDVFMYRVQTLVCSPPTTTGQRAGSPQRAECRCRFYSRRVTCEYFCKLFSFQSVSNSIRDLSPRLHWTSSRYVHESNGSAEVARPILLNSSPEWTSSQSYCSHISKLWESILSQRTSPQNTHILMAFELLEYSTLNIYRYS